MQRKDAESQRVAKSFRNFATQRLCDVVSLKNGECLPGNVEVLFVEKQREGAAAVETDFPTGN